MFNGEALRRGASKGRGSTGARRGEVPSAEAPARRLGFCQLPHARITLPFSAAITGMLLHRESNDVLMVLLSIV